MSISLLISLRRLTAWHVFTGMQSQTELPRLHRSECLG